MKYVPTHCFCPSHSLIHTHAPRHKHTHIHICNFLSKPSHCHFVALQLFHFSFVSSSGLCCISLCQHYLIHMRNLMSGFPRTLRAMPKTNLPLMKVSTFINFLLRIRIGKNILYAFSICRIFFLYT